MVWYVIVMMRPSSITGSLDGVGPGNSRLFWALKWLKANQKSPDFKGPPLPMPLVMDLAHLKILKYKLHIKKQVNWYFHVHKFACSCVMCWIRGIGSAS